LQDLSESLSALSKTALSTTENAILNDMAILEKTISTRSRILSAAYGKMCLQAVMLLCILLLTAGLVGYGMVGWLRSEVWDLRAQITTLKNEAAALEAKKAQIGHIFKGLDVAKDEAGMDYLLPPDKCTFYNSGKVSGTREAWGIRRR
jgi:hypothetical protein